MRLNRCCEESAGSKCSCQCVTTVHVRKSIFVSVCLPSRMNTSSAIRLLLSTWVALTTMQRKWRDNPSINCSGLEVHKQTNEWNMRKTAWNVWTVNLFPGARFKNEFYTNKDKKTKTATTVLCLTAPTLLRSSPRRAGGCMQTIHV